MRLAAIALHPVKSTAIRPVDRAYVGAAGLVGDREWMVVDAAGAVVTARERPELFRIVADNLATGVDVPLRLVAPGLESLNLTVPTEGELAVTVHGRGPYPARPAPPLGRENLVRGPPDDRAAGLDRDRRRGRRRMTTQCVVFPNGATPYAGLTALSLSARELKLEFAPDAVAAVRLPQPVVTMTSCGSN